MVAINTSPQETPPATSTSEEVVAPPAATRRRGRWWWLLAALAVVIGLTFVSPAGRHQWAVSFIRQPTPYTTLSFRDAAALPTSFKAGTRVHLSFTVANHEGRSTEYPVVVSSANLGNAHAMKVLGRTTLTVPSGGQRTTGVAVLPSCTASPCEVQISLPGHPETINVVLSKHGDAG